jgi:hypothetical protein
MGMSVASLAFRSPAHSKHDPRYRPQPPGPCRAVWRVVFRNLAAAPSRHNRPFSLPPTVENLQFLFYFVRMLLGKHRVASLQDEAAEDAYIQEAVEAIYGLNRKDRRLRNLSLPSPLYARLARWCEGGQYGHLFDNERDTIAFSHFTAFEDQDGQTQPGKSVRHAIWLGRGTRWPRRHE